ncbi:MAG: ABC transporter ATP-binding protein [Pseudomonadota bacterium]
MKISDNGYLMRLTDIHRTFIVGEVEVKVLRGVDLDVHAGELLIIQGESGSGKSTLMNMIGGIDQPTSGTIIFDGQDITGLTEKELTAFRRENVGFVFQFYNLVPTLSALENVATVTEIADEPMDPAEALDLVGLGDRMDHFPSQLSGGQQQRVAIARALAKRPKLMLCDEPTGALDHETSVMVLELIQNIYKKTGTTVVMITHAPAIAHMADRNAIIRDGRIAEVKVTENPKTARELIW